jgi:hypothetical protein
VGLFDEVDLTHLADGYAFGRKVDTYIMLRALSDGDGVLQFKNDMPSVTAEELASDRDKIKTNVKELIEATGEVRYDLIFRGGENHAWITEVSSVAQDGSFAAFMERMLENAMSFEDLTVQYTTAEKTFQVRFADYFRINGQDVDVDYARFDNAYVPAAVERKAQTITFCFGGKTLTLNFEAGTREEA